MSEVDEQSEPIVDITGLAAGGDGLGRDHGRVTFVPYAAVGDRVRVELLHVDVERGFIDFACRPHAAH